MKSKQVKKSTGGKSKSVKRQRESELIRVEEKRTIEEYDKILSVRNKNSTSQNPLELF